MEAPHQHFGKASEEFAARYLQKKGFTIIKRNYRYQKAEIDIIAQKDALLLFAEVKARSSNHFGHPEDFVTKKKQALLREAAEQYIITHDWTQAIRFDIIAVRKQHQYIQATHFEDAF